MAHSKKHNEKVELQGRRARVRLQLEDRLTRLPWLLTAM